MCANPYPPLMKHVDLCKNNAIFNVEAIWVHFQNDADLPITCLQSAILRGSFSTVTYIVPVLFLSNVYEI